MFRIIKGTAVPFASMGCQLNGCLKACRLLQSLPSARWLMSGLNSGLKRNWPAVLEPAVKARQQGLRLPWRLWMSLLSALLLPLWVQPAQRQVMLRLWLPEAPG